MIQDKLDVVKQAMARVNIDILGISELKWTITGKFNSDDHHIYTIVDKKWSYPQSQQKSLKCSTWVQSQKRQNVLVRFQHSNRGLCSSH